MLAELCRRDLVPTVWLPSLDDRALRERLNRRMHLVRVRTMARGEGSYNPIGYHVGTVWPHDSSFVAWGLARYGYRAEAALICRSLLEAAVYFRYRLPEVFAGYDRAASRFPVEFPTASSPQAWASGAPLLAIRTLLGLVRRWLHLPRVRAVVDAVIVAGATLLVPSGIQLARDAIDGLLRSW